MICSLLMFLFSISDTITVYYKGAEIIGIYKNLLGEAGFKKGLKLYFDRHDGTAVTCDDFRNAMAGKFPDLCSFYTSLI